MINCKQLYKEFLLENTLTPEQLPYSVYSAVIEMHNKEVMRLIVEENRSYDMGFHLGDIKAVEVPRKIRISKNGEYYSSVNWKATEQAKETLIKEGKLPYKAIKNEKGEIIGDNGGVRYIVYNISDTSVNFTWNRYRQINPFNQKENFVLKKIRHYHFKFTELNIEILNAFKNNNNISYTKLAL